jgi:ubiquinone biosynthesis protein
MLTSIKHTIRLFHIALTLAQHDALFGLEATRVSPVITTICKLFRQRRHKHLRPGQRLTRAFEALGPTFMKLGQALSVRADLVGEDIAEDLSQLRDQIPPFSSKIARATVEAELEKPLGALFSQFDDKPIAAASIAQVHFATTVDGRDVAVKILRPNIEIDFARDIELLLWLAQIAERRLPQWRRLKPVETVQIFAETISFELDMRYEAAAADELGANLKNDIGFHVPKIDWNHTSQRVLVSERIKGISLNDMDAVRAANIDLNKLVEYAATSFFNQVFRDGFFHADLHPGNLFVLPDNTLAAVDFGIMGRIDRETQIYLADMLWAFLREDYEQVARIHIKTGIVPPHTSVKRFAQANRAIAKPIFGKPLNEISIARLLGQLFAVAETFQMETQPQLLMLQKTMMLAEGVGRMLNPQVNMWKMAEPLIAEWAKSNLGPQARIKENVNEGIRSLQKLPQLVARSERIFAEFEQGGLKLHPDTARLLAGNGRGQRQWLTFAWAALALLAAILVVESGVLR